jgi:hypothetical protein
MASVIIGHTTENTARIWVRGDDGHRSCRIRLTSVNSKSSYMDVSLSAGADNTAIADFDRLDSGTSYTVTAEFAPGPDEPVVGRVHTFPSRKTNLPIDFSFVLSSCNLSVVSINNFLASLLAAGGVSAAIKSYDLPTDRWTLPKLAWLWSILKELLKLAVIGVAWITKTLTDIKQPGPPLLRSPFLKLSAIFGSVIVEYEDKPAVGSVRCPGVGDTLTAASAEGIVATSVQQVAAGSYSRWRVVVTSVAGTFTVGDDLLISAAAGTVRLGLLISDSPHLSTRDARTLDYDVDAHSDQQIGPAVGELVTCGSARGRVTKVVQRWKTYPSRWRVVVTHVSGCFDQAARLLLRPLFEPETNIDVGIVTCARAVSWYDDPAFFLHVGDQIYYDFPDEKKEPDRDQYRIAYREAWFDDDANRYLLSHWPQYMTLDDHEIADQFACDFHPPTKATPEEYLKEAKVAYDDYVQPRNPTSRVYWYSFEKGDAQFFVLDTRTQRIANEGNETNRIIDHDQMKALLRWMTCHRSRLKFVVTSVPFVAEIVDTNLDAQRHKPSANWYAPAADAGGLKGKPRNRDNDKWTAFGRQREQIIDHIAKNNIENLVFLTGDMHCCYHASMRIGDSKYKSTTIHELAGGPANQLQLSEVSDFHTSRKGETAAHTPYAVVLDRFHGALSAVMRIGVKYAERPRVLKSDSGLVPEVEWSVIRTLTDVAPAAWIPDKNVQHGLIGDREPTMAGRISFVRKRDTGDLQQWR